MVCDNRDGILFFDGVDTRELVKKYGTPLYVISRNEIHDRIQEFRECFLDPYPKNRLAYASKAFLPLAMCQIMNEEGTCLDVVSGGEIYTALKAGFPAERLEFNGNNKGYDELELAIGNDVGRIIVDSEDELSLIEAICAEKGKKARILYRINPAVEVHTHQHMTTGNKDSKFGIDMDGPLSRAIDKAMASEYVDLLGFHFHVGASIYDNKPYLDALNVTLDLILEVREKHDFVASEINIGGGFAAATTPSSGRPPYAYFLEPVMERVKQFSRENEIPLPAVVIEPGRSVIAEAGITLYTVGSIKSIRNARKYVSVDGGMTDNIRVELYDAEYDGCIANKMDAPKDDTITICGKCCESGDVIARDIKIAKAERGDIFALFNTGCYCYAMSNNYNKIPKAPVVLVKDGKDQLIVKRQSYEDMIRNEIMIG